METLVNVHFTASVTKNEVGFHKTLPLINKPINF
jgi:hypothetical protein